MRELAPVDAVKAVLGVVGSVGPRIRTVLELEQLRILVIFFSVIFYYEKSQFLVNITKCRNIFLQSTNTPEIPARSNISAVHWRNSAVPSLARKIAVLSQCPGGSGRVGMEFGRKVLPASVTILEYVELIAIFVSTTSLTLSATATLNIKSSFTNVFLFLQMLSFHLSAPISKQEQLFPDTNEIASSSVHIFVYST